MTKTMTLKDETNIENMLLYEMLQATVSVTVAHMHTVSIRLLNFTFHFWWSRNKYKFKSTGNKVISPAKKEKENRKGVAFRRPYEWNRSVCVHRYIVNRFLYVFNSSTKCSQSTVSICRIGCVNLKHIIHRMYDENKCNHIQFYGKNSLNRVSVVRCISVCMIWNSALSNIQLYFSSFCYTLRA